MNPSLERFPEIIPEESDSFHYPESPTKTNGLHAPFPEHWQSRKQSWSSAQAVTGGTKGHGRQKSLSDALRTIRHRNASISANVQEISDALKAPVSPRLVILCIIWYLSSALTNTSSKSILNAFPKPATLTLIQFAFVSLLCLFFAQLAHILPLLKEKIPSLRYGIRRPTKDVIRTTLPMAAFQIGGHLLSSTATAKIPVSLVHTIKGLSPLFTVLAYRIFLDIRYPIATYLSLIPLTLGVMLACSAEFHANVMGIIYALAAALIFVTQNIWSKQLFNEAAIAETTTGQAARKLDKLNLLCYSSGLAFVVTFPIWFCSEGITLLGDFLHDGSLDLSTHPLAFDHGRLAVEFVFNGVFHFGQNMLAFVLLSMVSPVTYSVASLIKRVFVVVIAIIWFQNPTTSVQGLGIGLTFFGLYLYDRTKEGNKADRKAKMLDTKGKTINDGPLLPLHLLSGKGSPSNGSPTPAYGNHLIASPGFYGDQARRKVDGTFGSTSTGGADRHVSNGKLRRTSNAAWVPPSN